MWWEAGRQFAGGEIELTHQDPVLATQLSTPTYKHKNGKILIEDKEEIKKRLSRSPDRADCFDDQTEILTERGWKFFKGLTGEELVLSLDPKTMEADYCPINTIIRENYKGKMFLYESANLSFCISPNHKLLIDRYIKKDGKKQKAGKLRFCRVENLPKNDVVVMKRNFEWCGEVIPSTKFCFSKAKNRKGQFNNSNYSFDVVDWFKFLGWWLSEGCVWEKKNNTWWVTISQSKTKNPEKWNEIYQLLKKMGISTYNSRGKDFVFGSKLIAQHLIENCGRYSTGKRIPFYIKKASPFLIRIFLNEFLKGDGYRSRGRNHYSTSSKQMADDLQELVLKCGSYASLNIRNNIGRKSWIVDHWGITRNLHYVITEYKKLMDAHITTKNIREVDYDGVIYDVSVQPFHTIYVRRNGQCFWSGNSYIYGLYALNFATVKKEEEKGYRKKWGYDREKAPAGAMAM